jgi:hypothetical protein
MDVEADADVDADQVLSPDPRKGGRRKGRGGNDAQASELKEFRSQLEVGLHKLNPVDP